MWLKYLCLVTIYLFLLTSVFSQNAQKNAVLLFGPLLMWRPLGMLAMEPRTLKGAASEISRIYQPYHLAAHRRAWLKNAKRNDQ